MKTTEVIQNLIGNPTVELGYELVDVEFKKEQDSWVLTVFIDKEGGITVEDCERLSRAIEPIIDEADPIAQSYFLSVSSPGLDRPLKSEKDYKRNLGKDVVIKLYAKQDNKKEFTGTLRGYGEDAITVLCRDGEERTFLFKDLAQVKPHIEF